VLEDVRWADYATLDVLRYIGSRVDEAAAVVVVTFRDREVGRGLQRVLGGFGGPSCGGCRWPALLDNQGGTPTFNATIGMMRCGCSSTGRAVLLRPGRRLEHRRRPRHNARANPAPRFV
jgi:hypothetical protein